MMGVAKTLPKLPKLVIENVPPCTSSGFNWRERARVARSTMERCRPDDVFLVGVANHRHDQSIFQRHRDADIDFVVIDDVVAFDGRVQDGKLVNRFHRRRDHERQVGQRESVALLEFRLVAIAQFGDLSSCRSCERW